MKGMKISVQKTTLAFFWRMDCGGGGASKSEGRETRSESKYKDEEGFSQGSGWTSAR